MTSIKTKKSHALLLGLLLAAFISLGLVLFVPKTAKAAINPEFTRSSVAQKKIATSVNALDSQKTSSSKLQSHSTTKNLDQPKAQSHELSAELAPPSGTKKTLPAATTASHPRKFIARQNKKKNRWVEVDLSRQKIMLWNGSHLDDSYSVSTGIWGHLTPTGTYYVYLHVRSQTMSGPGYSLPNVQYVQYFYGDYSLHGTWWHNNFGHPMSHGCVNLPTYKARELWNWAPGHLKVVIHP